MPQKKTSIPVEWGKRGDGSAWVSVGDPTTRSHFQCDYLGDMETGPTSLSDFACEPPEWVLRGLGLS